jgi:ketosteroid isomerase-like protein
MPTDSRTEAVRRVYADFRRDPDRYFARFADDVVFHIAGHHPLSGDYTGLPAVRRYLEALAEVGGGFTVTAVFTDETGDMVLVEGTAFHGDEPFVRTVVHLLRLEDGLLAEFWDNPFDQVAEDRFWRSRIPAQRSPFFVPQQPSQSRFRPRR